MSCRLTKFGIAHYNSAIPRLAGDTQDLYDRPDKNRNRGRMGNVATVNIIEMTVLK